MNLTDEQLLAISENPKDFLQRAYRIQEKKDAKYERIARIRSNLESTTSTIKENPGSSSGITNKIEAGMLDILELEEDIKALSEITKEIETAIELLVPDIDLQLLLELRYLNNNTWHEIADKMNYTFRWTLALHGKALKVIQEESTLIHTSSR